MSLPPPVPTLSSIYSKDPLTVATLLLFAIALAGVALVLVGLALAYPPAALVAAGTGLLYAAHVAANLEEG